LLAQLKKQSLDICALDSVFNAIVLNKILYALPVYFGYLIEGHKDMFRASGKYSKKPINWDSRCTDMTWTI